MSWMLPVAHIVGGVLPLRRLLLPPRRLLLPLLLLEVESGDVRLHRVPTC